MTRILKIAVCVVFVLSFVGEVFSIKCWSCDSKLDPKCGVPFDNSTITLTDCSLTLGPADEIPNFCLTQKQRVNGVWSYRRGCGFKKILSEDFPCASKSSLSDQVQIFTEYCPCFNKDGCNNSEN